MELEYTDKVAIIYETLKNIETAILRLQERTKEVKSVDDMAIIYKVEKSGLNDLLQVKYDNLICQYDTTIYKYDWRNEKSASRII